MQITYMYRAMCTQGQLLIQRRNVHAKMQQRAEFGVVSSKNSQTQEISRNKTSRLWHVHPAPLSYDKPKKHASALADNLPNKFRWRASVGLT